MVYGQTELDSHADTIAFGGNSIIMAYTGRECEVSPYTDSYESIKKVPIVQGATGYTSPVTGQRSILIFNEALWLGDQMQHTLVNPNQLLHYGLTVRADPYNSEEPIRIETENGEFVMPLLSDGTVIYLDTWTPTDEDLCSLPHVTMSSPHPWNPRDVQFPKTSRRVQEDFAMRSIAHVQVVHGDPTDTYNEEGNDDDFVYDIGNITHRILSSVKVFEAPTVEYARISDLTRHEAEQEELVAPKTFASRQRHLTVDAATLGEHWSLL